MKDFLFFIKKNLEWTWLQGLKFFVLVILTIELVSYFTADHSTRVALYGLVLLFSIMFPSMKLGEVFGIQNTANLFGSNFNYKYFFSLPMSKVRLLNLPVIFNLPSLIPALVIYSFLLGYASRLPEDIVLSDKYIRFFRHLSEHYFPGIIAIVLISLALSYSAMATSITNSRRAYYRGNFENLMAGFFDFFGTFLKLFLALTAIAYFFEYFKNLWFTNLILFIVCIYSFYKLKWIVFHEKLSYWFWKRDLIRFSVLMLITLIVWGNIYGNYRSKFINLFADNEFIPKEYRVGEPIFEKVAKGDLEALDKFLKEGGDPNIKNKNGVSLSLVVSSLIVLESFDMIRNLHSAGANLDTELNTDGKGCPHTLYCSGVRPIFAAIFNSSPTDKYLIEYSKKSDEPYTHERLTPLMLASRRCNFRVIGALIKKGSRISATDIHERTALMHAADRSCLIGALILVNAGAKINQKDNLGFTPIDFARSSKGKSKWELIYYLKRIGAVSGKED